MKLISAVTVVLTVVMLMGCSGDRVFWDANGQYGKEGEREIWKSNGRMEQEGRDFWINKDGEKVFK